MEVAKQKAQFGTRREIMRRFDCTLFALLASQILLVWTVLAQNNGGLQFTLTDLGTFGGAASIGNATNNKGQIGGLTSNVRELY
jgi:hypothetical protein